MSVSREESIGVGFGLLLTTALASHSAPALITAAESFEVSPEQLRFVRHRLRARIGPTSPLGPAPERLSMLQEVSYSLMSRRSPLVWSLLKETLLIRPPYPPPVAALSWLPLHWSSLISTCALTFTSSLLLAGQVAARLGGFLPRHFLSAASAFGGPLNALQSRLQQRRWQPPRDHLRRASSLEEEVGATLAEIHTAIPRDPELPDEPPSPRSQVESDASYDPTPASLASNNHTDRT